MGLIIAWLLIFGAIAMLVYTRQVGDFTGEIGWAESFWGAGGTYTAIKLFSLLMIGMSFWWMTGGLQAVLLSNFGVFFGL